MVKCFWENKRKESGITVSKKRIRFSKEQTQLLEKYFSQNKNPSREQILEIQSSVQLDEIQVRQWFKHRREKATLHLDDDIEDFLQNEYDKYELPLITRIQYISEAAQISELVVKQWALNKKLVQ